MVSRRKFIQQNLLLAGGACLASSLGCTMRMPPAKIIMTVNGPLVDTKLGFTLVHEHVMVDFIGAAQTGKHRYNAEEVYNTALPFLSDLKKQGCSTFVDCTPAYVGRDVQVLQRLSKETGLNIVTTTGYYGARKEQFYPQHVFTETAEQIAACWIAEYENGIDGTNIKPGIIKCGVDNGPLTPSQRKTIEAAAVTHLATGLTIGVHTGNGSAAVEEMDIIKSKGLSLSSYIWIHAQNEKDSSFHISAAKQGAWISFDAVYPTDIDRYIDWAKLMKKEGLLRQVLFSQDSGWYHIGEPNGGEYEGYTTVFEKFLPALTRNGFTQEEINQLFYTNPAKALAVKVRKL
jgi:predicted metal-dependent phosphotriesterase family hydrolase